MRKYEIGNPDRVYSIAHKHASRYIYIYIFVASTHIALSSSGTLFYTPNILSKTNSSLSIIEQKKDLILCSMSTNDPRREK